MTGQSQALWKMLRGLSRLSRMKVPSAGSSKSEVWNPAGIVPEKLGGSGTCGFSRDFTRRFFGKKLAKFRETWSGISELEHFQTQALLLRFAPRSARLF